MILDFALLQEKIKKHLATTSPNVTLGSVLYSRTVMQSDCLLMPPEGVVWQALVQNPHAGVVSTHLPGPKLVDPFNWLQEGDLHADEPIRLD
jgi:hypothetical protein